MAEILPLFEYVVQRFCGKYQPADPISYRLRKRQKTFVHDNNNSKHSYQQKKSGFSPIPHCATGSNSRRHAIYNTNSPCNGSGSNIEENSNNPFGQLFNYSFSQPGSDKKAIEQSSHKKGDI
jgi:hypothetical protein